jgi:predicted nuclease of predicted toxin-antitoxin system
MRFLANENFPGDAVTSLRASGHDVAWIRTDSPGVSDRIVLERAVAEQRVLLTFDKDFGELAWRFGLPAQCGIVLLRLPMPSAAVVGSKIAQILVERSDWEGYFSVVEPGRIRMRPLPLSGG